MLVVVTASAAACVRTSQPASRSSSEAKPASKSKGKVSVPDHNNVYFRNGKIYRPDYMAEGVWNNSWPTRVPVASCKYQAYGDGDEHFDCDDFAYAYKLWWEKNYPEHSKYVWTVRVGMTHKTGGLMNMWEGHLLNIVEVDHPNSHLHRFSMVEPQDNTEIAVWLQEGETPVVSQRVLQLLQEKTPSAKDVDPESMRASHIYNDVAWCTEYFTFEKDFLKYPKSCAMFKDCTDLDPLTMKRCAVTE